MRIYVLIYHVLLKDTRVSKDYLTAIVVVPPIYVLMYHVLIKDTRVSKDYLTILVVVPPI